MSVHINFLNLYSSLQERTNARLGGANRAHERALACDTLLGGILNAVLTWFILRGSPMKSRRKRETGCHPCLRPRTHATSTALTRGEKQYVPGNDSTPRTNHRPAV